MILLNPVIPIQKSISVLEKEGWAWLRLKKMSLVNMHMAQKTNRMYNSKQGMSVENNNGAGNTGGIGGVRKVGPDPKFEGGFWEWTDKINNGGYRTWVDPSSGTEYYIADNGELRGVKAIGGTAPAPSFQGV